MGSRSSGRSVLALACLLTLLTLPLEASAGRAYVSNEDGGTVSVLDTQRNAVIATIAVGKRPRGLKLSRDGKRLYAAVSGWPKCPPTISDAQCAKLTHDLTADGIAIIDTVALAPLTVLKAGSDPEQFDLSADGKRVFVTNEETGTVSVLGLRDATVIARIRVGHEPEGIRISPDGRWALVTDETDNTVSVIDARSLTLVRTVPVGQRPRDLAFTPDSHLAYVPGESDASLYRVPVSRAESAERLLQLRKEARPMGVLLDPRRQRLYLSTGRGGTVAVVSLREHLRVLAELPVGARPWGMALSSDGRRLYTANGPSNDVSVVDTTTLRILKRIPVGHSPWAVVLGPDPR